MALVASPHALAALWAKAADQQNAPSPPQDERRATSEGKAKERRLSSGSGTSQSTAESSAWGSSSSSQERTGDKEKEGKKYLRRGRVVLHVQDCAFALHERQLKRKCRVLHGYIRRLREQNAVGEITQDEPDTLDSTSITGGAEYAQKEEEIMGKKPRFVLRPRKERQQQRGGSTSAQFRPRCPLQPRQHLAERAAPSTAGSSSSSSSTVSLAPKFPRVCCLTHQQREEAQQDQERSARQEMENIPGKENYASPPTLASSTVRTRSMTRVALAPKMPFTKTLPKRPSVAVSTTSADVVVSTTTIPTPTAANTQVEKEDDSAVFNIELLGATPEAVAVLLEFIYSGRTGSLNESNARTVTNLCKWLCMEDRLLSSSLSIQARALQTVDQWMDILLACTTLRSEQRKSILVHHLLRRLMKLTPDQYLHAMEEMPLHRLSAIEDADILSKVILCMVNHIRQVAIWRRLTFALELWLYWSFRRPYASSVFDHQHVPVRKPMSLAEFHQEFVTFDPVIRITDKEVSGIDAYVQPTTLFTFGPFAYQIRLDPQGKALMRWRVIRRDASSELHDNDEYLDTKKAVKSTRNDPPFTVRGRLRVRFRHGPRGSIFQDEIPVRYTHRAEEYGKWHMLLSADSTVMQAHTWTGNEPESEEKAHDADPPKHHDDEETKEGETKQEEDEEEETAPHESDAAIDAARAQGLYGSSGDSSDDPSQGFQPLMALFSGQFYVWGHRLCNMYHFLLVSTLFYQVPTDCSPQVRLDATLQRMRELPVETLVLVLTSDRLRIPDGETTLAVVLNALCLSDYGTSNFSNDQIRALYSCVRWCFVDLEQIMQTLERSRRELFLYELIEDQLREYGGHTTIERREPWGVSVSETPYRATTTLIEFQIEAGDRSLSPSKFPFSQE